MQIAVDDFGKNSLTNRRMLELANLKVAQRVAVLADGTFSSEEINELKNSGVLLDIHLNLFTLDGKEKSTQEPFSRVLVFAFNYLLGKYSAKKVQRRWEAQIEQFNHIFERFPDGINSHEHKHFFPPYFKAVINLAKKFDISYIRFAQNGLQEKNNIIAQILNILWKINLRNFKKSSLKSSHFLVSFDWLREPEKFLAENRNTDIEIVCHPERDEEYEILKKLEK